MTWSEAQAQLAESGCPAQVVRFVFSTRVFGLVKVTLVVIAAVGAGAAFVVMGSDPVKYDRATGLFSGVARSQVTNSAAVGLHSCIAAALGLGS